MKARLIIVGFAASVALGAATLAAQGSAAPPATPGQAGQPAGQAAGRGGRGAAASTPSTCGPNSSLKNTVSDSRCFELRTYVVRAEGPGNLDLLHARFRQYTLDFFKKHGMTLIGFWQPVAKPDTLIYLLAYKDAATRDADWAAFNADPGWLKVRADMNVSVQVTSEFMVATDYSPMK